MDLGDLILIPVFIFILHLIFKSRRKAITDPVLKTYHQQGFWVKMTGSVFFLIFYGMLTGGDSIDLYHLEGKGLYEAILADPQNIEYLFKSGSQYNFHFLKNQYNAGYFLLDSNYMMIRIDALLNFITFGRYGPVNLILGAIAFSGIWKLFLFFYSQYPHLHKKFAIAILFFPTIVFWSSGLLKDTLCLTALGWLTWSAYDLFYNRRHLFKNTFAIGLSVYFLALLKVYILLAYLPFFALFLILKNIHEFKNPVIKIMLAPTLILGAVLIFSTTIEKFDKELGAYAISEVTSSILSLNENLSQKNGDSDAASNFSLGAEFEPTFYGLIKIAPYAITATFFRPFIWEAGKVTQMLAALESMVLIFFTVVILLKAGPFQFVRTIFKDPLIMYCFLFAIVFGLFVGASTVNFGTLVRYKIPCLPFFAISLFLIYEKIKERAAQKSAAKQAISQTQAPVLTPAIAG